jgi:hypothetical protein
LSLLENKRQAKYLVALRGGAKAPKRVAVCPSLDEVKKMLSTEVMIISFLSLDGYDFSSEYLHVYQGRFDKESAFQDCMAVAKRALRVCDPALGERACSSFAEYVVRLAAWEALLCAPACEEATKSKLEKITSKMHRMLTVSHMKVFMGRNSLGELVFHVRTVATYEPKVPSRNALAKDDIISFLYYKTFLLDEDVVK